ncbi:MAG: hypothetical protein ABW321_20690, partial [Polyangiales bacterium]
PDHVVVIAINKTLTNQRVALKLWHPTLFKDLATYQLTGAAPELVSQPALTSTTQNAWLVTLPAQSVNVLVPSR